MRRLTRVLAISLAALALWPATTTAQVIGTFKWQLQPYCDVVTLTVTQRGASFTLDGTDDACAPGGNQSGTSGVAFVNPDGQIGMALTSVRHGGAQPVHTAAIISVATVGGAWRDSAGNSGTLVLAPGGSVGGVPRLVTAIGLPPLAIGSDFLAPSSVTSSKMAPNAINSSTQIADNTIDFRDLRQQLLVSVGLIADVPAGGCIARESTGASVASVRVGDLLIADPLNLPAGAYALPLIAGNNGRFGYMVCNATAAAMDDVLISLELRRVQH